MIYTISSPSNSIQNTAERAIYANPSGRMDISRLISMVPSVKWTLSVCLYTNASSPSGHDFGPIMVDRRPRTSSQMQWKNKFLFYASCSRKFFNLCALFFAHMRQQNINILQIQLLQSTLYFQLTTILWKAIRGWSSIVGTWFSQEDKSATRISPTSFTESFSSC